MVESKMPPPVMAAEAAPATAPPPVSVASTTLFLLGVLFTEVLLFAVASRGDQSVGTVLVLHLVLVAAVTLALWHPILDGRDDGRALLGVLAILATGPFGAAGALLMPLLARRNAGAEARLSGWYHRIALSAEQDDFTQLSDRVAIGRSANLAAPAPTAFAELFRSGPIAEQQSALGMIARAFHPGYLPVLKIALESPEPMIRVQAAAVAARIRGQLETSVAALFDRAADPTGTPAGATAVASELDAAIASGLLEESTRLSAVRIRDALLARTFARLDARARDAASGAVVPAEHTSIESNAAFAAHLLAQGRAADFRAARLAFRQPLHGRYRHRIVIARPIRAGLSLAPLAVRR